MDDLKEYYLPFTVFEKDELKLLDKWHDHYKRLGIRTLITNAAKGYHLHVHKQDSKDVWNRTPETNPLFGLTETELAQGSMKMFGETPYMHGVISHRGMNDKRKKYDDGRAAKEDTSSR